MEKIKEIITSEQLKDELNAANQKLRCSLNEKFLLLQHVHDLRSLVKSLNDQLHTEKHKTLFTSSEINNDPFALKIDLPPADQHPKKTPTRF